MALWSGGAHLFWGGVAPGDLASMVTARPKTYECSLAALRSMTRSRDAALGLLKDVLRRFEQGPIGAAERRDLRDLLRTMVAGIEMLGDEWEWVKAPASQGTKPGAP